MLGVRIKEKIFLFVISVVVFFFLERLVLFYSTDSSEMSESEEKTNMDI